MKFSVIGTGVIGRLRAETVRERPGLELVSVADVDLKSAEALVQGSSARAFSDYRAAIEATRPDVVIISSPVHLHEEMALAAFEAGAHVLVEKPLSNSVASCERIVAAARQAGRALGVGYNHRYYPSIRYVKDIIDQGRIGTLDHLRVFGGHDGLANFRADWMYKSELSGGGALMDVGIHMTDLAAFLGGGIARVYGRATEGIWKVPGSEDNAMALFESPSGLPMIYQATWTEWKGYRFYVEAYGDRGMVKGYYAPMFNLLVERDPESGARKKSRRFYPEIILREKLKGWQTTTKKSFEGELADFLLMIEGKPNDLADGPAALLTLQVSDALKRSQEEARLVGLDEVLTR